MLSYAPQVVVDPAQVARLQALLEQLPLHQSVTLTLAGGHRVSGRVAQAAPLQPYIDCRQRQGLNALVRLDDLARPLQQHVLWLDSIVAVQPMNAVGVAHAR